MVEGQSVEPVRLHSVRAAMPKVDCAVEAGCDLEARTREAAGDRCAHGPCVEGADAAWPVR